MNTQRLANLTAELEAVMEYTERPELVGRGIRLISGGWILAGADAIEEAGLNGYARQIRACAE
jgi:hypothetical protein